jgi:glycosyltransferase involved in cell wall biosynthesis
LFQPALVIDFGDSNWEFPRLFSACAICNFYENIGGMLISPNTTRDIGMDEASLADAIEILRIREERVRKARQYLEAKYRVHRMTELIKEFKAVQEVPQQPA